MESQIQALLRVEEENFIAGNLQADLGLDKKRFEEC